MDVKKTCLGEEMATAAMAEEAQTEAILGYRPRFFFKELVLRLIGVWEQNT